MNDESRGHVREPEMTAEMVFVAGDRGAGLVITGLGRAGERFQYDGAEVKVWLETLPAGAGIWTQTLRLEPEKPVRFQIRWLIPEGARNAAMTLNGGLLISPFDPKNWPADGPALPTPECGNQTPVSTLKPGCFQAVNFLWQNGDTLTLHLVL